MAVQFRWTIQAGSDEPIEMWHFPAAIARAEKEAEQHPGETVRLTDNETGIPMAIWRSDGTSDMYRRSWPKAT